MLLYLSFLEAVKQHHQFHRKKKAAPSVHGCHTPDGADVNTPSICVKKHTALIK